jgi:regulator of PEP synthase PpsR (kinase-PPPase family)
MIQQMKLEHCYHLRMSQLVNSSKAKTYRLIASKTEETKTKTETSRAETGRDQEYVVQGRTDQIRTHIQKIQNLCIKIMLGIIASSQRTVDGTPRKEFNQKLRTSDQHNKKNNSLDLLRHIK